MSHKVLTVQGVRSLYLLKVGIVLSEDLRNSLLESLKLVAEILELQLDNHLLRKLLTKKLPHLVGLTGGEGAWKLVIICWIHLELRCIFPIM